MKGSKRVRVVASTCAEVLASVVLMSTVMPQAHADAKLLHFDRPASESVPGLYYVLFKTEQELRQLLGTVCARGAVWASVGGRSTSPLDVPREPPVPAAL